jgi:hypothetical protein
VLTKLNGSNQHFNAYYHNNRLLVQFIISEFILTYRHIQTLEPLETYDSQESLQSLFDSLHALLRSDQDTQRPSSSLWIRGPLVKLKDYAEQFSLNTNHQDKQGLLLYTYVHQTWLTGLHALELTHALLSHKTLVANKLTNSVLLNINRILKQLRNRLKTITKQIPRVLAQYRKDETVLFFLLRKKELLLEIYGSDFISKILKPSLKLKKDPSELVRERYAQKGFEHVLMHIDS